MPEVSVLLHSHSASFGVAKTDPFIQMATDQEHEIQVLRAEVARLKRELAERNSQVEVIGETPPYSNIVNGSSNAGHTSDLDSSLPMSLQEYKRYGRQMLLESFGLPAQLRLRNAKVVVVGAGGLGCPALQYLAAAGVGTIGIVDHDTVELSNLPRQILHTEVRIGTPKALSATAALSSINSSLKLEPHVEALTPSNAVSLLTPYDLILDCTDSPATRYLLSDTAVTLQKPLVSGAAVRYDGQLATYNLHLGEGKGRGPCYRCMWPVPPKPDQVGVCEEVGVLGTVTGVIGTLQAMEAIKIITGLHDGVPTLLLFSALSTPPFRSIKLRPARSSCPACGSTGNKLGRLEEMDYVAFCGGQRPDLRETGGAQGTEGERISAKALHERLHLSIANGEETVDIIDVRPPVEYGICHIPGSRNVSLRDLLQAPMTHLSSTPVPTYVVCRLGNDSQLAVQALRAARRETHDTSGSHESTIQDVIGGLRAWSLQADPNFPIY